MSAFEDGELVDISIRGARVGACIQVGNREILRVAIGPRELELPLHTGVQVTRVAPKEWPPQPGDIWDSADSSPWGGPWFARGDNGTVYMAPENAAGPSERPETLLGSVSGLTLVHRRGWSPTTVVPADEQPVDERAECIAGLREMADWLEANPDVPADTSLDGLAYINRGSNEENRAELLRVAGLIGADADLGHDHPRVIRTFRGGVSHRVFYLPVPADKTTRAGDSDLAPEVPAVATTQPGPDVTHGEGKVGASPGVAGAPTWPGTEHVPIAGWGGEPGRCGVECSCGTTFDGFDTLAEAEALHADHAARLGVS